MLVAAAVCPCPPLLVPEVASGAAAELEPLRLACAAAVAALAAARPDRLVVVGPVRGDERGWYGEGTTGSFAPFGVDVEVVLGRRRPAPEGRHLPASLAVGAWLLQRYDGGRRDAPYEGGDGRRVEEGRREASSWKGGGGGRYEEVRREAPPYRGGGGRRVEEVRREAPPYKGGGGRRVGGSASPCLGFGVDEESTPAWCLAAGRDLAAGAERVALLVMGDGSASREGLAAAFDADAAAALAAADTKALQGLDEHLAAELTATGRAPWQVLAGAATGAGPTGRLLRHEAPYGVGYIVAEWAPDRPSAAPADGNAAAHVVAEWALDRGAG